MIFELSEGSQWSTRSPWRATQGSPGDPQEHVSALRGFPKGSWEAPKHPHRRPMDAPKQPQGGPGSFPMAPGGASGIPRELPCPSKSSREPTDASQNHHFVGDPNNSSIITENACSNRMAMNNRHIDRS